MPNRELLSSLPGNQALAERIALATPAGGAR